MDNQQQVFNSYNLHTKEEVINILNFEPSEEDFIEDHYRQELWFPITELEVPNIIPDRYMISTWGKVYDKISRTMHPTEKFVKPNYPNIMIKLIDGNTKTIAIHILMCLKFKCFKGSNSTEIDHVDGVRYHNWIWNLDWVSHQENLQRAVNTGLYGISENHQNSIFTNSQIEYVCELIQQGLQPIEILNIVNNSIAPNMGIHTINDIKGGNSWTEISSKYDFSNAYHSTPSREKMSEDYIHKICKCLEENGKYTKPKHVANMCGLNFDEADDKTKMYYTKTVERIRNREIFKDICKNYNY